jgi:hypothetical protein
MRRAEKVEELARWLNNICADFHPLFVISLTEEGSAGISGASIVHDGIDARGEEAGEG